MRQTAAAWGRAALATDVASLKVAVLGAAAAGSRAHPARRPAPVFVGAHPMCGTERSGYAAARDDLFDGARVWLCPLPDRGSATALAIARDFWTLLGGRPRSVAAPRHDRIMANASHLPQLVSNALAAVMDDAGLAPDLLGPGGRDMTRLAGSSPTMWLPLLKALADEDAAASARHGTQACERTRNAVAARPWQTRRAHETGGAMGLGKGLNDDLGMTIRVPGDKSITQRALIFAALAEGESRIGAFPRGADPLATASALRALGVRIRGLDQPGRGAIRVRGLGFRRWRQPRAALDLMNSGTGARLLAGALAAQPLSVALRGDESLSRRPMERICAPLRDMGAAIAYLERDGTLPMRVTGGRLREIRHRSAVASAQVKSAILLAGLGGGVPVEVREPRRSRDHSERMLEAMGAEVVEEWKGGAWAVRLPRAVDRLAPLHMDVPGDFSSAAFFLAWAGLAARRRPVAIRDVGLNPTRTGLLPVLARMGAQVEVRLRGAPGGEPIGDLVVFPPNGPLRAVDVGEDEVPGLIDEVPVPGGAGRPALPA